MSKTTDYATTPPRTMPHQWSFSQQRIQTLQAELDVANESNRQYSEWCHNLAAERDALLEWAQAAYTRLQSLMTIGVSMTPDAVTKQLLEDAPESVKGGEK